ncbi:mitochondrial import inner membrane translocase subunit TIM16 [Brachionus plicatilis]|uniref:Mitochondrial import inner membrane translocase subunit TIM16 n=1 Tax=Brachionus plicatilis TaxID=10195 RepID=A0A3M7Q1Q6_BRAPC|nr:mitochondrial import inner membrane translocase subunit TIM16 [Brachionus plicatilis]
MAQHLVRVIILGAQVVGRAFTKALRNEFQHAKTAQSARGQSAETTQTNRITGISIEEAKQILNLSKLDNPKEIEESYKRLFELNDKTKGGSFYLQSKIYRAKERIDQEIKNMAKSQESPKE